MSLTLVLIVWFQVSQLLTLDKYQNIEKVCLVVLNCRYNKQTTRIPDHSCPVLFENPQSVQFRLRQTTNATLPVKPFITARNTMECWDRFMILFALIQVAKFSLSHRYIKKTCTQNELLLVYCTTSRHTSWRIFWVAQSSWAEVAQGWNGWWAKPRGISHPPRTCSCVT